MAPVYRCGLGPTFVEEMMLSNRFNSIGSFVVATTDGDAAAAPVNNCYWIREAGGNTARTYTVGPEIAFAGLTYEWPIISAHRIEGTITAGTERLCEFMMDAGLDIQVLAERLSNSTFRYVLSRPGGANSSGATRNVSTNYGLRVEFNGTNVTLTVDGSLDVTIPCTDMPTQWEHTSTNMPASWKQYFCGLVWRGSNDLADRPNTSPTIEGLDPESDFESAAWGDQADCTVGVAGQWSDWVQDGGDDSDRSIYLCEAGGDSSEETSEMGSVTMSNPKLVQMRYLASANLNTKVVVTHARLLDSAGPPNVSELQLNSLSNTQWRGVGRPFVLDANGDPWTQARVNAMRCGVRTVNTNTANPRYAFMRAEVFDLGDDPPSAGFALALVI